MPFVRATYSVESVRPVLGCPELWEHVLWLEGEAPEGVPDELVVHTESEDPRRQSLSVGATTTQRLQVPPERRRRPGALAALGVARVRRSPASEPSDERRRPPEPPSERRESGAERRRREWEEYTRR